jgi:hypothetical protein
MKTAYRRQAKDVIRNKITYITKLKFLLYFRGTHDAVITKGNI